jgi:hypothetical protein
MTINMNAVKQLPGHLPLRSEQQSLTIGSWDGVTGGAQLWQSEWSSMWRGKYSQPGPFFIQDFMMTATLGLTARRWQDLKLWKKSSL